MNIVVYGGQYGSEGKASASEFWANKLNNKNNKLVVIGENSPNSGHTCSLGITRNIPACSYFADLILLGPDSIIDIDILLEDWRKTGEKRLFIHENVGIIKNQDRKLELDLVNRISSTGSGSGKARQSKFIDRKVCPFPIRK